MFTNQPALAPVYCGPGCPCRQASQAPRQPKSCCAPLASAAAFRGPCPGPGRPVGAIRAAAIVLDAARQPGGPWASLLPPAPAPPPGIGGPPRLTARAAPPGSPPHPTAQPWGPGASLREAGGSAAPTAFPQRGNGRGPPQAAAPPGVEAPCWVAAAQVPLWAWAGMPLVGPMATAACPCKPSCNMIIKKSPQGQGHGPGLPGINLQKKPPRAMRPWGSLLVTHRGFEPRTP